MKENLCLQAPKKRYIIAISTNSLSTHRMTSHASQPLLLRNAGCAFLLFLQELPCPHIRAAIPSPSKGTCKATPYQGQSVKTSATGLTRANLFFTPQERTTRPNCKCADSYSPRNVVSTVRRQSLVSYRVISCG